MFFFKKYDKFKKKALTNTRASMRSVKEVCGVVGALSAFVAAVVMFIWVDTGQVGVESLLYPDLS